MGQIVGAQAKCKRCNISAIQTGGSLASTVLASGEYVLVSSDNSMGSSGSGKFDCYIVGDGVTAASGLDVVMIDEEIVTDATPTAGSVLPVQSGGTYSKIDQFFDIGSGFGAAQPTATVDNRRVLPSQGHIYLSEADGYVCKKYSVTPGNEYCLLAFYKTKYSNLRAVTYAGADSGSGEPYLGYECAPAYNVYTSYENVMLTVPEGTAYIYVTIQKTYADNSKLKERTESASKAVVAERERAEAAEDALQDLIDEGYRYIGVVSTSSVPGSFDGKVFAVTADTGIYTNFLDSNGDPIEISQDGLWILSYNGSWSCASVYLTNNAVSMVDDALVKSSGIYKKIDELYDKIEKTELITPISGETGKYVIKNANNRPVGISENNSLGYYKYSIDPSKEYYLTEACQTGGSQRVAFYCNADDLFISMELRPALDFGSNVFGTYENVKLNVPSNAAYVYVNYQLKFSDYVKVKERNVSVIPVVDDVIVSTNDTTDRTADILAVLTSNKICRLGKGVFYVNGLVMPDDTTLIGVGKSTKVVLGSNSTTAYAIRLGARCTVSDMWIDGNADLTYKGEENIAIDSIVMDGNRHGILLLGTGNDTGSSYAGGVVTRCEITNFTGGGITCDNTWEGTYSSLEVSDCWIRKCCVGINIAYHSEFNKFVNVGCWGCRYGCINNGGNNSFSNCGFNSNMIGFYMNGATGKCIRYDGTAIDGANMGHGVMDNCILDHNGKDNDDVGYAIVAKNISPGYQFSNLSIHYNKMYFEACAGITMCNCKVGAQKTGVEIKNLSLPMVMTNMIGNSGMMKPFILYSNNEIVSVFDSDGNGGKVYMRDCFSSSSRATPRSLSITALASITTDGASYISLGKALNTATDDIEVDFGVTNASANNRIFGSRTSTTSKAYTLDTSNGNWRLGFGNSSPTGSAVTTGRHVAKVNHTGGVLLIDGNTEITNGDAAITTPYAGLLFAVRSSSGISYADDGLTIYGAKKWESGVLKKDLVPAKRSDGAIGMYDKIGFEFIPNGGSGTFSYESL